MENPINISKNIIMPSNDNIMAGKHCYVDFELTNECMDLALDTIFSVKATNKQSFTLTLLPLHFQLDRVEILLDHRTVEMIYPLTLSLYNCNDVVSINPGESSVMEVHVRSFLNMTGLHGLKTGHVSVRFYIDGSKGIYSPLVTYTNGKLILTGMDLGLTRSLIKDEPEPCLINQYQRIAGKSNNDESLLLGAINGKYSELHVVATTDTNNQVPTYLPFEYVRLTNSVGCPLGEITNSTNPIFDVKSINFNGRYSLYYRCESDAPVTIHVFGRRHGGITRSKDTILLSFNPLSTTTDEEYARLEKGVDVLGRAVMEEADIRITREH